MLSETVLVVVVVVVIEEIMQFGHEQLDVYRVSLESVGANTPPERVGRLAGGSGRLF